MKHNALKQTKPMCNNKKKQKTNKIKMLIHKAMQINKIRQASN